MDYELQACTRHCAATGREFQPGEEFYSVVVSEGAELKRLDYAADAWKGPPPEALGWWKSQIPLPDARRVRWAPNDVMLNFFEELQQQPERGEMLYVLALLLLRRRVLRQEEQEHDPQGNEVLQLYCPRRETTYRVGVLSPDAARINEIQEELARLLFADAK